MYEEDAKEIIQIVDLLTRRISYSVNEEKIMIKDIAKKISEIVEREKTKALQNAQKMLIEGKA